MNISDVKKVYDLTVEHQELSQQLNAITLSDKKFYRVIVSPNEPSVDLPKEVIMLAIREHIKDIENRLRKFDVYPDPTVEEDQQ